MAVDGASQQPTPAWLWHAGLGLFAVAFLTFLGTGGGRAVLGVVFNNPVRVELPRGMDHLGDGLVGALFVAPMIPIAILAGVVSPGSAYRWVPLLVALLASCVGAAAAAGWRPPRG
jgi:hypothetical protein